MTSDDNYLRKIVINKSVHEYDHGPRSRALRRFPVPSGIKEAWEGRSVTKCRLWAQTVTSLRQDDDVAEEEVSNVDQDHCTVKPWRCKSFAKMSKSFELCSRTLKLIMRSWEKAPHWSRTYFSATTKTDQIMVGNVIWQLAPPSQERDPLYLTSVCTEQIQKGLQAIWAWAGEL